MVDACDAEGGCVSEKVGSGAAEGLPEHQHVQLWHIKKKKEDGVRFGHAVDDGLFKHPACDLGGLTNLRQKLGEPVAFAGTPVLWGPEIGDLTLTLTLTLALTLTLTLTLTLGDAAETVAKSLLVQWRELTGKALVPNPAPEEVTKFLDTVKKGAAAIVYRPLCAPVLS